LRPTQFLSSIERCADALATRSDERPLADDAAGDPVAGVAGRLGRVIVLAAVDYDRGADLMGDRAGLVGVERDRGVADVRRRPCVAAIICALRSCAEESAAAQRRVELDSVPIGVPEHGGKKLRRHDGAKGPGRGHVGHDVIQHDTLPLMASSVPHIP
jgi:hypothetical protein